MSSCDFHRWSFRSFSSVVSTGGLMEASLDHSLLTHHAGLQIWHSSHISGSTCELQAKEATLA